jgi:hypothetical protein
VSQVILVGDSEAERSMSWWTGTGEGSAGMGASAIPRTLVIRGGILWEGGSREGGLGGWGFGEGVESMGDRDRMK